MSKCAPRRGDTRPSRRRLPIRAIIPRPPFPSALHACSLTPGTYRVLLPLDDSSPIICAQLVRRGLHQLVMSDDVSGGTGMRICTYTHTHLHTLSRPPLLLPIENLFHPHYGEISGQNRKKVLAPI